MEIVTTTVEPQDELTTVGFSDPGAPTLTSSTILYWSGPIDNDIDGFTITYSTPDWWQPRVDSEGRSVIQPRMLPVPQSGVIIARSGGARSGTIPFGVLQNSDGSSARKRCRCIEKKRRKVLMEIRYIPLSESIRLPGQEGKKFVCKCSHLRRLVNPNDVNRFN